LESIEVCNAIFTNISKSFLKSCVGEYFKVSFASSNLLNSGKKSNGCWGMFHYLPFTVAYVNQPKYVAMSDPLSSRLTFMQEEWLDHMGDAGKYVVERIDR
jgi:hypothetical protein